MHYLNNPDTHSVQTLNKHTKTDFLTINIFNMKRVFMLFFLMIGWLANAEAGSSLPLGSSAISAIENSCDLGEDDPCDCVFSWGSLLHNNMGSCEFRFLILPRPIVDDECAPFTIGYEWDFGTGTFSPGGFFAIHTFGSNGTFLVRVRITITTATGTCDHIFEQWVTADCYTCDVLDCTQIDIKDLTEDEITFTFPLNACEDCTDPHYTIGWKEKYGSTGWTYGGYSSASVNEVTLPGLDPCKEYQIIIELRCDGENGDITDFCIFDFMTDCDCELDCDEIVLKNGNSTSFSFFFKPVNCPDCPNPYYNIGWRVHMSGNPWNYGGTSYYISLDGTYGYGSVFSLAPCTHYDLIIELKCPDENSTVNPWQTPTVDECILLDFFETNCPFAAPDMPVTPELPVHTTAYPNPARDAVNILVASDQHAEGVIQIFNNLGTLVKQLNAQTNATTEISLQGLESGVYYYTFIAESGANLRASGKLVIVK